MNGPKLSDYINVTDSTYLPLGCDEYRDLSKVELEAHVWRGKDLRAEHIRSFGRRFLQTWISLWRRPGSIIPKALRSGNNVDTSGMVGPA